MAKRDGRTEITAEKLGALIQQSGFPFELQVARELQALGLGIAPSYRFFDHERGKGTEIDVLATERTRLATKRGVDVTVMLRLAVECKDNGLPFVCLGLRHEPLADPDHVDPDSMYLHINTTRDRTPNWFSIPALDASTRVDVRAAHHQLQSATRFYAMTGLEECGKAKDAVLRVSTPEKLRYALDKLGAFAAHFHQSWPTGNDLRGVETLAGGPVLSILFLMLVHSGDQYRYVADGGDPTKADSTTVLLNAAHAEQSVAYAVDVVQRGALAAAIAGVRKSVDVVARRVVPAMLANPLMPAPE